MHPAQGQLARIRRDRRRLPRVSRAAACRTGSCVQPGSAACPLSGSYAARQRAT